MSNCIRYWTNSLTAATDLQPLVVILRSEMLRKNMLGNNDYNSMIDNLDVIMEADLEEELDKWEGQNAVRIMNLHKAKGLEAPVVFWLIHLKDQI